MLEFRVRVGHADAPHDCDGRSVDARGEGHDPVKAEPSEALA
jgi:hypothetical protein